MLDPKNLQVAHIANRSVVFKDTVTGKEYFACKRVANEILSGEAGIIIAQKVEHDGCYVMEWLATPSRF